MDTSPTPSVPRFSLRNVLVIVVPVSILTLGYYWHIAHEAEQSSPQEKLHHFLRFHLKAPTKLDEGLIAADGDLVAAPPKDAKGTPKEWKAFSAQLEKNGMAFQAAFKAKSAAAVSKAAVALNDTCAKCHAKFR